jgi:hypothetical protein
MSILRRLRPGQVRSAQEAIRERDRRWAELRFREITAEKTRCVECGGQQSAEMGLDGPYVFCVECGRGSPERG